MKDFIKIPPATAAAKALREDARRNGVGSLNMRDIDRIVAAVRRQSLKTSPAQNDPRHS
jgi:hypothetical protein